jgi:hypothetical protein
MAGDRFIEAFAPQGIELATVAIGTVAIGELSCRHGAFHRHVFSRPGEQCGRLASRQKQAAIFSGADLLSRGWLANDNETIECIQQGTCFKRKRS